MSEKTLDVPLYVLFLGGFDGLFKNSPITPLVLESSAFSKNGSGPEKSYTFYLPFMLTEKNNNKNHKWNLHWVFQARVWKIVVHGKDDICVIACACAAEHCARNLHRLANFLPLLVTFPIVDGESTAKRLHKPTTFTLICITSL
jgi:hypothetical protein